MKFFNFIIYIILSSKAFCAQDCIEKYVSLLFFQRVTMLGLSEEEIKQSYDNLIVRFGTGIQDSNIVDLIKKENDREFIWFKSYNKRIVYYQYYKKTDTENNFDDLIKNLSNPGFQMKKIDVVRTNRDLEVYINPMAHFSSVKLDGCGDVLLSLDENELNIIVFDSAVLSLDKIVALPESAKNIKSGIDSILEMIDDKSSFSHDISDFKSPEDKDKNKNIEITRSWELEKNIKNKDSQGGVEEKTELLHNYSRLSYWVFMAILLASLLAWASLRTRKR